MNKLQDYFSHYMKKKNGLQLIGFVKKYKLNPLQKVGSFDFFPTFMYTIVFSI